MTKSTKSTSTNPKGKAKRRVLAKPTVESNIKKHSLTKIARRGGVKRLPSVVRNELREMILSYCKKIVNDAEIYTTYSRRKTVVLADVNCALVRNNMQTYGF